MELNMMSNTKILPINSCKECPKLECANETMKCILSVFMGEEIKTSWFVYVFLFGLKLCFIKKWFFEVGIKKEMLLLSNNVSI